MIAAELRGGSKPSLNEALGWIGSRVDDIYGANVGRLEDVWIDPGTGVPRWLLVKEGRFGGRTTLIPFEDATAGAGHVWVPYERDVVRAAPEIEPGAPLTQHVEASLRSHYAASVPASIAHGGNRHSQSPTVEPATIGRQHGSALGTATVRFHSPPEAGPPHFFGSRNPHSAGEAHHQPASQPASYGHYEPHRPVIRGPQPAPVQPIQQTQQTQQPQVAPRPEESDVAFGGFAPRMPERPAPPVAVPEPPRRPQPVAQPAQQFQQFQSAQPPQQFQPAQPAHEPPRSYQQPGQPAWQQPQAPPQPQPDPAQGPVDELRALAESGGTHYVEIELSGELTIRGELRSVKVTPRPDRS